MLTYRQHEKIKLYGALFLLAYFGCSFFRSQAPFPFFNWDLYSKSATYRSDYEVLITSLQPGVTLQKPLSLGELQPEYHQDWLRNPHKVVATFGSLMETGAPAADIEKARRLVENYLLDYPNVDYDLVRMEYDPLRYAGNHDNVIYHKIASFHKGEGVVP